MPNFLYSCALAKFQKSEYIYILYYRLKVNVIPEDFDSAIKLIT